MTVCPACGENVRPIWPTCRSCGTLLMAPPAPFAPVGAAVTPAAPSAEEQFFAPAVLQPPVQLPPSPHAWTVAPAATATAGAGAGKWLALIGIVAFVIAAVATARFTLRPGTAQHPAPVALAPRAERVEHVAPVERARREAVQCKQGILRTSIDRGDVEHPYRAAVDRQPPAARFPRAHVVERAHDTVFAFSSTSRR